MTKISPHTGCITPPEIESPPTSSEDFKIDYQLYKDDNKVINCKKASQIRENTNNNLLAYERKKVIIFKDNTISKNFIR